MPNMSYCRFQKTLLSLQECKNVLEENGTKTLSPEELKAAQALVNLCAIIENEHYPLLD